MRRFQNITLAALVICLAPVAAHALVTGTLHDMSGYTGSAVTAKLCQACHTPHNAGSTLWAMTPSGTFTGVQDLCYTCHDGTITSVGSATAFSTTLETHTTTGSDCSGGTNSCHDVHDNTNGKFLTVTPDANGVYCTSCHGSGSSLVGGDHLAGSMHFTNATFTCNNCHAPHGAVMQTDGTQVYPYGDVASGKPILLADNNAGGEYGTMCISCHNNQAPFAGVVGDVYDYQENTNDGSESQHPTYTTSLSANWGTMMIGCVECHDVHDSGGAVTGNGTGSFLLSVENTHSASCIACHDGTMGPDTAASASSSHYVGIVGGGNVGTTANGANLPWGNQLDEDGAATNGTPDFALNTANTMMCETCHSVHKNGVTGAGQGYFLRVANGAGNDLCRTCHSAN